MSFAKSRDVVTRQQCRDTEKSQLVDSSKDYNRFRFNSLKGLKNSHSEPMVRDRHIRLNRQVANDMKNSRMSPDKPKPPARKLRPYRKRDDPSIKRDRVKPEKEDRRKAASLKGVFKYDKRVEQLLMKNELQDGFINQHILDQIQAMFPQYKRTSVLKVLMHTSISFLISVYRSRDVVDLTLAATNLMNVWWPDWVTDIPNIVTDLVKEMTSMMQDGEESNSSWSGLILSIDDLWGKWEQVRKTSAYKSLSKFLRYVFSVVLGFLPGNAESWKFTSDWIGEPSEEYKATGLSGIFGEIISFLKRGTVAFNLGHPLSFFLEATTLPEWLRDVDHLKVDTLNMNSNRPGHSIDPQTLLTKMRELIRKGKELKNLLKSKSDKEIFRTFSLRLEIMEAELSNSLSACDIRQCPMSLLITSVPNCAKSTFINILHSFYADVRNKSKSHTSRYVRNFSETFWSNYKSTMWCIILDDLANEHPDKINSTRESSVAEIIQIMNNVGYICNMAKIEEKGNVSVMAELVLATTNTEHLNAQFMYACPYAVQRRFPFVVELLPKEAFCVKGSLSPQLLTETDDLTLNCWNIVVKKPTPPDKAAESAHYENVEIFSEVSDFLKWFKIEIDKWDSIQKKVVKHANALRDTNFCLECCKPELSCVCKMQDGFMAALTINLACLYSPQIYHFTSHLNFYDFIIFTLIYFMPTWLKKYILCWKMKQVVKSLPNHAFIGAIAFVLAPVAVFSCWKLFMGNTPPVNVQGGIATKPVQRTNAFYRDDKVTATCDLSRKTLSWKGLTKDQILKKIARNTLGVVSEGKIGHAIALNGQLILTNYHLFAGRSLFTFTTEHGTFNSSIADADRRDFPDQDITILRVRNLTTFPSIIDLFPVNHITDIAAPATMVLRRYNSDKMFLESKCIHWHGMMSVNHEETCRAYVTEQYNMNDIVETVKGDCGSPYVAFLNCGPAIVAIHQSLGVGSFGVALNQIMIKEFIKDFPNQMCGGSLETGKPLFPLTDLSEHSNLRTCEKTPLFIFGSSKRFPSRSNVHKSLVFSACVERGWQDTHGAPVMRDRDVWKNQLIPMMERDIPLDGELLFQATQMYIEEVVEQLTPDQLKQVRVLSDSESFSGIVGESFIDPLPKKTSAGFPFCQSKSHYLEGYGTADCVPKQEIYDMLHDMESEYIDGNRCYPIYMGNLKDEPRKKSKIASKMTRLFAGSSFPNSLIIRKYLLSVNALIQNDRFLFESFAGTNCAGPDWKDLYLYLIQHGKNRICAGDYAQYDKTMSSVAILSAFDIIEQICIRAGYSDAHLSIVRGIAMDMAFPVVNIDGDISMFDGCNPSGHPLTVIINCLVNCIYLRMAFISMNPGKKFKHYVAAATYGDDNIFGVKEGVRFDHTSLSEFLATQGLTYTMAEKDAVSVPFLPISKCTFLQRSFVESGDDVLAPLSESSRRKMIMYAIPSQAICDEAQCVQTLDTYSREHYFLGHEVYHAERQWCLDLIHNLELDIFVRRSDFPTFEQMNDWYHGGELSPPIDTGSFVVNEMQDGVIRLTPEQMRRVRSTPIGNPSWLNKGDLELIRVLMTFTFLVVAPILIEYAFGNGFGGTVDLYESAMRGYIVRHLTSFMFVTFYILMFAFILDFDKNADLFVCAPFMILFYYSSCFTTCFTCLIIIYKILHFRFASSEISFIQDGTICSKCGNLDCWYQDETDTQLCLRCQRCRSSEFMYMDSYDGCAFCEAEHPFACDCCHTEFPALTVPYEGYKIQVCISCAKSGLTISCLHGKALVHTRKILPSICEGDACYECEAENLRELKRFDTHKCS